MTIHPTAVIEDGAIIGKNVVIEPFAIIKSNVVLGDNVVVKSFAYIDGYTTVGKGTTIWQSAMIGNQTQDLKFRGEKTFIDIGEHCQIREFAIITSSTVEGSTVSVGNNCLLMPWSYIAHNCSIGNHVVLSNQVQLAGHVQVGDYAVLGGMVGVHQFVRIGAHAMVGAMSAVRRDIPPFSLGHGDPYYIQGINRIGLRRRGISLETRIALAKAMKLIYSKNQHMAKALDIAFEEFGHIPEVAHLIQFCSELSKRGVERKVKREEPVEV